MTTTRTKTSATGIAVLLFSSCLMTFYLGNLENGLSIYATSQGSFSLTSDAGVDGGTLPAEYTCDSSGASPALAWSNVPAGTQEFALMMTTLPGDGSTKWSWVLYSIPGTATSLAKNTSGVGILGVNQRGTRAYEPPCSQGPGAKVYTFTLYALSASPALPAADQVTGAVLTQAIASITVGSASLSLSYTRPGNTLSAAFTFAPITPVIAQTVVFTDTSTGDPTLWSWSFGDGSTSAIQNPTHAYSAAGNFTVTLVASNAGGSSNASKTLTIRSSSTPTGFTINQTLSDEAQRNTIAFDGLAFLTGNLGGQSFLPPGKVADLSGFQYLRDNDPTNMGHNTDFVTIIAFNILHILARDQVNQLIDRAQSEVALINEYAYERFPLMEAFRRLLEGDLPQGSTGLDKQAVMNCTAELGQINGQILYDKAQLLGGILRSLTTQQKSSLDTLKSLNGVGNWNRNLTDPLKGLNLDRDVNIAVMTYASEMYSWYAGSIEADTYFCPEGEGTYFGSFYLKDWPAMGNPNYTINEQLTATAGQDFLKVLTSSQAEQVTGLVDIQKSDLYEIVQRRSDLATELRGFLTGASVDNATVMNLAARYGELDGEIVYYYATHFTEVYQTLNSTQKAKLEELVDALGYVPCTGAFLYSSPISMPEIINTDFLFGAVALQGPAVYVSPYSSVAVVGQNVTIAVNVANVSDLYSWEIKLYFNSSSVNCTIASYPDYHIFAGKSFVPVTPVTGPNYTTFGASLMGNGRFEGSGTLCLVNFTSLKEGASPLSFDAADTLLLDSNLTSIPTTRSPGLITVVLASPLTGDVTGPTGVPDGIVNMYDVSLVAKYFGQTVPPAPSNCDITGSTPNVPDGRIDMRDISTVAKHFGEHYP